MSKDNDKRELREFKRDLKRLGNKRVRRLCKQELEEDPLGVIDLEVDYGRFSTKELNGRDRLP